MTELTFHITLVRVKFHQFDQFIVRSCRYNVPCWTPSYTVYRTLVMFGTLEENRWLFWVVPLGMAEKETEKL